MALLTDRSERRLLPIWKSFKSSIQELQPIKSSNFEKGDISTFLYDWKAGKNIANAGDIISAAIVNSCTEMEEVQEAANYVLNSKKEAPYALYKNACSILGLDNYEIEQDETHSQIAVQKALLIKYPTDAILHIEIARNYLLLGQIKQAKEHIERALYFDRHNRYIVRCAARFFIHTNELEKALYVIRTSSLTRKDPWLMASEIGISQVLNKISANIKRGMSIIDSGNYSMFDITELSSAIGTQEWIYGAYSKSRKLFNCSLKKPNNNSLAQAKWICNEANIELNFEHIDLNSENFWEAKSYNAFKAGEYHKSLKFAESWIQLEPYSTRAILYAYRLSVTYLEDLLSGEKILNKALIINPNNPTLVNNYAYTLALEGKIEEAEKAISKGKIDLNSTDISHICLTATKGMIALRKREKDKGDYLYHAALEMSRKMTKFPDIYVSALLNYCREILIYENSLENKKHVKGMLKEVTGKEEEYRELVNLRKQVDVLLTHHL